LTWYQKQEFPNYPKPALTVDNVILRWYQADPEEAPQLQLLLIKRKAHPFLGHYALPGGFGEVGYSPTENILKEIQEETGYSACVIRLLAVFDTNRYQLQSRQYVKLVFECELLDGNFEKNQEISDLAFFEREKIPALSTKRNTEEQLNFLWEVYDGKRDLYCD